MTVSAPDPPGSVVHGDVVPAFSATYRDSLQEVIAGRAGHGWDSPWKSDEKNGQETQRQRCGDSSTSVSHGDPLLLSQSLFLYRNRPTALSNV